MGTIGRKNFVVDGLTTGTLQVQGHVTQKLGQISKIWPKTNLDIVL